jgi:hypothetical protein
MAQAVGRERRHMGAPGRPARPDSRRRLKPHIHAVPALDCSSLERCGTSVSFSQPTTN